MKFFTALGLTTLLASALAACGGPDETDESTRDALAAQYLDNRDFDEFDGIADLGNGADGSDTGGGGGVVFATHSCTADAGTSCTNFGLACESNGGTLTTSADGRTSTCDCDRSPPPPGQRQGGANPQAVACDNAVK